MAKRPLDIGGARRFSTSFINVSALENAMAKKNKVVETPYVEPVKEPTIQEKLQSGYYKTKLPYAPHHKDPHAHKTFSDDENRLDEEFKFDALREAGLLGHPKADKIYSYAWQKGHASGHSEVLCELYDVAELFVD